MKNYFVCSERYDHEKLDAFLNKEEIKGVVIGDLFCHYRMFERGIVDMILFMNQIWSSDKAVIYQAPLYVTGRNIEEVKSVLSYMNSFDRASYVIVQDFGTAEMIARDYAGLRLIWGQLGRVREHRYSDDFLKFLVEKKFAGMEAGDRDFAGRLLRMGLIPFFNSALLQYHTLGRVCYLKYQVGKCDRVSCMDGRFRLRAVKEDYEMTIDGYMLGKRYLAADAKEIEAVLRMSDVELIVRNSLPKEKK